MRVIAGSCRGRPLRAPRSGATRPTADKVREAIFDVLGSMLDLEGLSVADLFAGSGALGIEALSRGAGSAVFVDDGPEALTAIRANLASLGLEDRSTVVRSDVLAWLGRPPGVAEARAFDLALCDPPYDFARWPALLERLEAQVAVLESSQPVDLAPPWGVVRQKRYGGTLVTVIRREHSRSTDQKGPT